MLEEQTLMARSPFRSKLLLIGGAVVVAGAAALLKRDKVAGLLPSRSDAPEPYAAPAPPPQPSNYDAPGPVANTATPVPAPDPVVPEPIDEAAEEAAAAAEAANIGGAPSDYAGPEGEPATEAERPLAEAGEGESEGQEQTEAELAANAEYRDAGMSDAERQIEDTIEQVDQPQTGETPEPLDLEGPASSVETEEQPPAQGSFLPPEPPATPPAGTEASDQTATDVPGGGISGRPYAGLDKAPEPEAEGAEAPKDDDPDDWRTWSGRSVKP
jgi:hypothetical protein